MYCKNASENVYYIMEYITSCVGAGVAKSL
jgi:hypothetical protein